MHLGDKSRGNNDDNNNKIHNSNFLNSCKIFSFVRVGPNKEAEEDEEEKEEEEGKIRRTRRKHMMAPIRI